MAPRRSAREALKPMTIAWLTRWFQGQSVDQWRAEAVTTWGVNNLLKGKRFSCPAMTKTQMRCTTVGFEEAFPRPGWTRYCRCYHCGAEM